MMRFIQYACFGLAVVGAAMGFAAVGYSAERNPAEVSSILVDANELSGRINDSKLRLLDVRSEAEYSEAHIPGAVRVSVGRWKHLSASEGGFSNAVGWAGLVGELGITRDHAVVVYGGKLSDAARIWWLLKFVGADNVRLLDGGWDGWNRDGRPVETRSPPVKAAMFEPRFQTNRLAEIDGVRQLLGTDGVTLLDTRSDREFKAGRIPGAVQLEWTHLVNDEGRFKTVPQLKSLFKEYGVETTHTTVCY